MPRRAGEDSRRSWRCRCRGRTASRNVTETAIEQSLPDAVGAFVDWLVTRSGWKVTERDVRIAACRSRRGTSACCSAGSSRFGDDVTRAVRAGARSARHAARLLVGGKSFHEREEVETMRAALAAIEWPDDELSVFGTLRGSLFAIGDEELLEYRHALARVPSVPDARGRLERSRWSDGEPRAPRSRLRRARLLQQLHRRRNYRPVAETIARLLDASRAHAGFVLRPSGEQALANVQHVAELARQYEASGGISFRGFVDELRDEAESAQSAEAPILEEGSDGVRLMTVHQAKGLEFPVVILADITRKLARDRRAAGWTRTGRCAREPRRLGAARSARSRGGGGRARRGRRRPRRLRRRDARARPAGRSGASATMPADGGWLDPLSKAIYPLPPSCREARKAPGCPAFTSKDPCSSARKTTPHRPPPSRLGCMRVWCGGTRGPVACAETSLGLRRDDLIVKDVDMFTVDRRWRITNGGGPRDAALEQGSSASLVVRTVTELAHAPGILTTEPTERSARPIEVLDLPRPAGRPSGPRFGTLVTACCRCRARAEADAIRALAASQARILGATTGEIDAAVQSVAAVLAHPLLDRARAAAKQIAFDASCRYPLGPGPRNGRARRRHDRSFIDDA